MSTKHRTPDKGTTAAAEQFSPVAPPRPMTEPKLAACRQPDRNLFELAAADETVVFAIAHRHGIAQNFADERERAAQAVLYATADGEHAVERWVDSHEGSLSEVDRAMVVQETALSPADGAAKRFAPVARRHPEV